jgi:hypothetical protein
VLADLLQRLGAPDVPSTAEAAFAGLAGSSAVFAGLDYDVVGAQGAPTAE